MAVCWLSWFHVSSVLEFFQPFLNDTEDFLSLPLFARLGLDIRAMGIIGKWKCTSHLFPVYCILVSPHWRLGHSLACLGVSLTVWLWYKWRHLLFIMLLQRQNPGVLMGNSLPQVELQIEWCFFCMKPRLGSFVPSGSLYLLDALLISTYSVFPQ